MLRRFLAPFLLAAVAAIGAPANSRPNVLLIISDDLTTTLGCYGHPQARTPNLDALAKRSVRFERAYCQFPHCNPSRSSFLTGLRPNTTRVTLNEDNLYDNLPDAVTLPTYFRQHGYATARCGKIFHLGVPAGNESRDDPKAWDFRHAIQRRASLSAEPRERSEGQDWQETGSAVAGDSLRRRRPRGR